MRSDELDGGFTLVELLVVLVVVGVLAAIAVPALLVQRERAVEASMASDLRTIATHEETHYVDHREYLAVPESTSPVVLDELKLSPGSSAAVEVNTTKQAYCIVIVNARATRPSVHISSRGGPQPRTVTACPAAGAY